jgi:hypothetical protein
MSVSESVGLADIDDVKAATTARTIGKRIVCKDVMPTGSNRSEEDSRNLEDALILKL